MKTEHASLSGWGQFPRQRAILHVPSLEQLGDIIAQLPEWIPRGLGRSYGDSALSTQIISSELMNQILSFDRKSGVLHCESGVSVADIIRELLPQGWALPVTPGTQWVTIGGAIASDVHGKNHHHEGCFSDYVQELELMLPSGDVLMCSPTQNEEIFFATCGGMGLTGFIMRARIRLMPVSTSLIQQISIKSNSLEETVELLELYRHTSYSVAWIDALANKKNIGRGHVLLGEHVLSGELSAPFKSRLFEKMPLQLASPFLQPVFLKAFNAVLYHRQVKKIKERLLSWEQYFYPLDKLMGWHQVYGKPGFAQYQFVLPKEEMTRLKKILLTAKESGVASALSVLKICGKENNNFLSFPKSGISLAMDFKITSSLWKLLDHLDEMVTDGGGRVYLTKDCRLSAHHFREMYPRYNDFLAVREKLDPHNKMHSLQSKRLQI